MAIQTIRWVVVGSLLFSWATSVRGQEQSGSIRGVVYDKDFNVPLASAQVIVLELERTVKTSAQGTYSIPDIKPDKYTLVFAKEGYVRQIKANVVVSPGQLTDVDMSLGGDFTDLEEFIVQDLLLSAGTSELALLKLRFESPALLDSISSDFLSRAGASDAASALRLVAGATVQDGKFAVIRGLPDRYVASQLNGFRLPSADEDTRAAELDQFPSSVIDSIRIRKTFTPDQQGDASGGAVDVRLKGIPEETVLQFSSQISFNSQVAGRDNFLTYPGGGVSSFGGDERDRRIQFENLGNRDPLDNNWDGAVGVSRGDAPIDYKFATGLGGKHEFDDGVRIGGFASFFYERDSAYFDNGVDNSLWVTSPGEPLTPETGQGDGAPPPNGNPPGNNGDFLTSLFDVTQGAEQVQWGTLGTFGVETENSAIALTYLFTRTTEDKATLAEDTRGKAFYFPGYNPNDPNDIGNELNNRRAAPYLRTETLEYTERETETLQLTGNHKLVGCQSEAFEYEEEGFGLLTPEIEWGIALSSASLDQPDKRQFGSEWQAESFVPGRPPFSQDRFEPAVHRVFKPGAVFSLGNLQRIFKTIEEESEQGYLNFKVPFRQWGGEKGYFRIGVFDDSVEREFRQATFTNAGDQSSFDGNFDDRWSAAFPLESNHPIEESLIDVNYDAELDVFSWYAMADVPLTSWLNLVGGFRVESTELEIVNDAEQFATWFPPGATGANDLTPGAADVSISEKDLLPAFGVIARPNDKWTFRASYSETIARPTFKELTPILQQEFLGGPVFIGNPEIELSSLKNYDLRVDYEPYEGGLFSVSYFHKDLDNAIENVQRFINFNFTTPRNFPEGRLRGWEFEARQNLGNLYEPLEAFSVGANATLIDSKVRLPDDERALFEDPGILAPQSSRDATNAPEHLYNFYINFDAPSTGTEASLFYTVRGDTLVAGAGVNEGNLIPSVYEAEFNTLNFSLSQSIWGWLKLRFQAKNLTNPTIETVYRSPYVPGGDVTETSSTRGVEFSLTLSAKFRF